jgi:hypothetical protein
MAEGIEELKRQVAAGEYVVDPEAVAAAILSRRAERLEARRLSAVLVAGQLDRLTRGSDEPRSGTSRD